MSETSEHVKAVVEGLASEGQGIYSDDPEAAMVKGDAKDFGVYLASYQQALKAKQARLEQELQPAKQATLDALAAPIVERINAAQAKPAWDSTARKELAAARKELEALLKRGGAA